MRSPLPPERSLGRPVARRWRIYICGMKSGAIECGVYVASCGPLQEHPQHESPHSQPTTNRHSGFPRTAAARAVAQDAIYTCFHYDGRPSTARGPSLAAGRAPIHRSRSPPACSGRPSGGLREEVLPLGRRREAAVAPSRLPKVAAVAALHCLLPSRPLFSEKQGVPRPKRECSGPYSVFELGVKHAAGL